MNAHTFSDSPWFNGVPLPETDDEYWPGDIVTLLTGSPPMTVLSACGDCGSVDVAFYDDDGLHILDLPEAALVPWDGEDE